MQYDKYSQLDQAHTGITALGVNLQTINPNPVAYNLDLR